MDDTHVEAAQRFAAKQGTSADELIRSYIARLAGQRLAEDRAGALVALIALFEQQPGDSRGAAFTRDGAYDGRV